MNIIFVVRDLFLKLTFFFIRQQHLNLIIKWLALGFFKNFNFFDFFQNIFRTIKDRLLIRKNSDSTYSICSK